MPQSKLRVLPLGGLGEIGKNMTVVEYDGSILVVDVGLRFPTAEQVGIDLVLPDFTYLRERADDIEGIVITHGHEDHLGALDIELIHLTHSIPDMMGVAITTDVGTMLITGDYKFDQTPVDGKPADVSRLAELGREGLLLLCGDSTNADRPGFSPSESIA